jgi:predicted nucleotidyltransferase
MKAQQTDEVINLFRSRVRQALGPTLVAIHWFGSRARGRYEESSDYDLLLETETELTEQQKDQVADIAVDIAADFGTLLDIHYRSVRLMKTAPYSFSPFIDSVLTEGVLV